MKREGSSIYDHLQSDPRFAFRGAPSSYLSGQVAALCRNVRAQVSGVPPETTYWATGVAAIRKEERVELEDGTVYSLTATWVPEPKAKIFKK